MKKLVLLLLLVSACTSTKPSNFYNIASIKQENVFKNKKSLNIGIDLVLIPNYLRRPQIVTLKNEDIEYNISEINRWIEPLSNSLQRVIADNISFYLPNSRVKPLNSSRKELDYSILVEINRFEGRFNDEVYIDAWWTIFDKNSKIVSNGRSKISLPIGDNYTDLVKKQSELVGKLSLEIAKSIK